MIKLAILLINSSLELVGRIMWQRSLLQQALLSIDIDPWHFVRDLFLIKKKDPSSTFAKNESLLEVLYYVFIQAAKIVVHPNSVAIWQFEDQNSGYLTKNGVVFEDLSDFSWNKFFTE